MTDKHPAAVPETTGFLEPCPFCGGQAVVISAGTYADGSAWPYIECLECGASAEPDIWNRRAPTDQVHPASDSDRGDTGFEGRDEECICRGNWRAIVKECEPLFGKRYRDGKGNEYTFFGVVHSDDDYYYGMNGKAGMRLLSCVGAIDGFGFELIDGATESGMAESHAQQNEGDKKHGN